MSKSRQSSTQLLTKGLDLAHEGRIEDAIQMLKTSLRINPKKPETHYGLGLLYLMNSDRDAAMKVYETLTSIDTELAKKLAGLGYLKKDPLVEYDVD